MATTPDNAFVPLTPGTLKPQDRPDFRVTIISQADAKGFASAQQKASWTPISQCAAHEPQVSLVREGDKVSAIRVQCVCGRSIELACVYETAPIARPAPAPTATADAPAAI